MYAVPAQLGGQPVMLRPVPCLECGGRLYFSHDEVDGNMSHRYASCKNLHSTFFTAPNENCIPIEVDQLGFLIDDTTPGWQDQIPEWARWEEEPEPVTPPTEEASDAPYCMQCGVRMQVQETWHACPSCGATSGKNH